MALDPHLVRAGNYVKQAHALLLEIQGKAPPPPDLAGEYVSLLRNLESAEAEIATLTKGA